VITGLDLEIVDDKRDAEKSMMTCSSDLELLVWVLSGSEVFAYLFLSLAIISPRI
jgi:hypothetical protein